MTLYPVRVSPDGVDVAVRSNEQGILSETAPWRASGGMILSDAQVADWMPYAPAPQLDTAGGPAEEIARVLDGAVESRNIDDAETSRALRDAIMHSLRIKGFLVEETGPVDAAAAAIFDAWAAAYPPRIGRDPDVSKIPAMLVGLPAHDLEILALAMGNLRDIAWDARRETIVQEERAQQGIAWATVNVTSDGRLLPDSVVTVDETAAMVLPVCGRESGSTATRLSAALRTIGYEAVDLHDTMLDGERLSFLVRKVGTDER